MKPRVLMVENDLDDYHHVVDLLGEVIPTDKKFGIEEFLFQPVGGPATSAAYATALLEDAAARKTPFDILILDLQIPDDDTALGRVIKRRDKGLDLLKLARGIGAAREIIIYTQFTEYNYVLSALRDGAIDFVEKNWDDAKELPTRVLGCWQRILSRDSVSLLEQRIKDLIPYAEAGLAHRYTTCFSALVETVAQTSDDIIHYVSERFGLDPEKDSQDYLFRRLKEQEAEMKSAQENWAGLNADLSVSDEAKGAESLASLLISVHDKMMPCQLVKNTRIEIDLDGAGEDQVLSFRDDVRAILQEIVAGTLSSLPDHGPEHTIKVDVRTRNGQAEIRFSDDLNNGAEQRISLEDAQVINGGFVVGPDHGSMRFGRAWGLSVAQHIALRGGGRLIVKPQVSQEGSQVTYFVPLAQRV